MQILITEALGQSRKAALQVVVCPGGIGGRVIHQQQHPQMGAVLDGFRHANAVLLDRGF